nr:uncharacterized protein LOC106684667 [Halyomorpha halys]
MDTKQLKTFLEAFNQAQDNLVSEVISKLNKTSIDPDLTTQSIRTKKAFHTNQQENKSIAEYVAPLKSDLSDCHFSVTCKCSFNHLFLRSQFIKGLKDDWIREQLLQSDKNPFNQILKKAMAMEAA